MAASWRTRFQDLLEDLNDAGWDQVALAGRASGGVSVGDEGIAIGGDAYVRAENQAAAP